MPGQGPQGCGHGDPLGASRQIAAPEGFPWGRPGRGRHLAVLTCGQVTLLLGPDHPEDSCPGGSGTTAFENQLLRKQVVGTLPNTWPSGAYCSRSDLSKWSRAPRAAAPASAPKAGSQGAPGATFPFGVAGSHPAPPPDVRPVLGRLFLSAGLSAPPVSSSAKPPLPGASARDPAPGWCLPLARAPGAGGWARRLFAGVSRTAPDPEEGDTRGTLPLLGAGSQWSVAETRPAVVSQARRWHPGGHA